ncbi:RHS repeat-associated core domain-containing protein [Paenibacillus sp. WLX1005]|uniref:RHS repeat-associated core domain-containing protein n=1 Tax=Paenibacillus sp. WLX1005 TaxID=3243766 RepID=UPI0039843213
MIGDKASNGTVSSYVRGDRVLVKKDLTNQKDYYYLYNGHRDVVQMIATDGSVVNSYQYDEWGSLTQQKETVGNEFKYAGETYDAETGLYYLKARYYDPAQGRFLNEDTNEGEIDNPLTLNVYSYVNSNPLIFSDPTGHAPKFGDTAYGTYAHNALGIYFLTVNMSFYSKKAQAEKAVRLTNGNIGFADYVLQVSENKYEVYELKPITWSEANNPQKHQDGRQQLQKYIDRINKNGLDGKPAIAVAGTSWNPEGLAVIDPWDPTKEIAFYTVEGDPGMIYYGDRKRTNSTPDLPLTVPDYNELRDKIKKSFKNYHPDGVPLPNGLPPIGGNKYNGGFTPWVIPVIPVIP